MTYLSSSQVVVVEEDQQVKALMWLEMVMPV